MTAPLDEKGLMPCPICGGTPALNNGIKTGHFDYVEISCAHPVSEGPDGFDDGSSEVTVRADTEELAIAAWNRRAYLAASPSPSEMEATIRRLRDYRPPSADPDFGREHHPICDEAADLLSQAQSALAAKDAEAKKWWLKCCETQQDLNAAEAQVLRLTEENEALRRERTSLIETKREQIDRLTADRDHNAAEYEKVLNSYADENQCFSDKLEAAEARIKALEEALRPFAHSAGFYARDGLNDAEFVVNISTRNKAGEEVEAVLKRGDFRAARTTLQKEQADG